MRMITNLVLVILLYKNNLSVLILFISYYGLISSGTIKLSRIDNWFNIIGINSAELASLNEFLQDLLDGIQVCLEHSPYPFECIFELLIFVR